jgi:hypothetical protein
MVTYEKFLELINYKKENTMAQKFVAFIPHRGTKGSYGFRHSEAEEFTSVDNAKVWIGRKLVADPEIDNGFIYRLESEVRMKELIKDHVEVVDRR